MAGFRIDAPAVEEFASTCDVRAAAFAKERQNLAATHVDRDSFGCIPGIGERIAQAYEQHVQACSDGVATAAEAMAAVADGLRAVVANYQGADGASRDGFAELHRRLDDVTIRGVR